MKKKIILASASPRRKEILSKTGIEFEVITSDIDENLENLDFEYKKIENLAFLKAHSVAKTLNEGCLVVAADTVVVLDGQILGKPKDKNEAYLMLNSLSSKIHQVVTSICVLDSVSKKMELKSVTSEVEFFELKKSQIEDYIDSFEPFDKAGSYGIQELPQGFVKNIKGSLENIIGICSNQLNEMLSNFSEDEI